MNKINKVIFAMFIVSNCLCVSSVFAESAAAELLLNEDTVTWKKYENSNYGYEILYPANLELWLTGGKSKRHGKTVTIGFRTVSLAHGLDFTIYPEKTISQIVKEFDIPNLHELKEGPVEKYFRNNDENYFRYSKVKIKGNDVIKGEYGHKETGEIFFTQYILDKVVFRFEGFMGGFNKNSYVKITDKDEQLAEEIISSFRWTGKISLWWKIMKSLGF